MFSKLVTAIGSCILLSVILSIPAFFSYYDEHVYSSFTDHFFIVSVYAMVMYLVIGIPLSYIADRFRYKQVAYLIMGAIIGLIIVVVVNVGGEPISVQVSFFIYSLLASWIFYIVQEALNRPIFNRNT
ncbi:F0F1-type ATP synthase assembly protein I [Geomicrobium sediminis]|uniref:F0F1-type ATP synthase assembly protein I n=1 Tax=Geomicrobium sediminis TaxID=1347788 RepID=A0ABS2P730_9BACL|nr:F0F1-type ATP synthase assembly protein I [Geomicrobium sediminis]